MKKPQWAANLNRYASVIWLLAIVLLIVIWGYVGNERPANSTPQAAAVISTPEEESPQKPATTITESDAPALSDSEPKVASKSVESDESKETIRVRGVVKAKDEVLFSSKIAGRISLMPYKEGQRFQKGAVLVAFDCARLRAEVNAAWAANRASQQIHKQSLALDAYQAIGKTDVQVAQAKAEQTGAEAIALEAQIRDCTIIAPFSGIVVENLSHLHENAAAGRELTKVLNDADIEVHMIAPSGWLNWLRVGSIFHFRVDETGNTHEGHVVRLGAVVDPVSQTVRVVGVLTGKRDSILPGMSGSGNFEDAIK